MKIRKIQFEGHPILGNLSLDFTDQNGHTVDNIIIAGENGCGKSVLLNELFNYNPIALQSNKTGKVLTEIEFSSFELSIIAKELQSKKYPDNDFDSNIIEFVHDFSITSSWEQLHVSYLQSLGKRTTIQGGVFYGADTSKLYKLIYSDVAINFMPKQISTVTAKNIDENLHPIVKSSAETATEITQLLIDIDNLDNADLSRWVKENRGIAPPDSVQEIRMKRFTNAFNIMFPLKRFAKIDNINGKKKVLFEEHGRTMSIEDLSSGEKQIVFRGGFLLRDKANSEGAIVLVDEPELSLHPKWQMKILNFIRALFTNEKGCQTSQIIIATHSPLIIHGTDCTSKVIILKKGDNGNTYVDDNPEYYYCESERLVESAFGIKYMTPDDKPTIFVEGETDEQYFRKALEVYDYGDILNIQWIGRRTDKGTIENTGDTALNSAHKYYLANPSLIRNKIILLYDCDTNKQEEVNGSLYIRKMETNDKAKVYKIGVENLLILDELFEYSKYYTTSTKTDDYGATKIISELNKSQLCKEICNMSNDDLKNVFANIQLEIDKILTL